MRVCTSVLLPLAVITCTVAMGVEVGDQAPALTGKTWVSATGTAPELSGKVHVVEFWFAS